VHELERAFEVATAKPFHARRLPISATNLLDPAPKGENVRRVASGRRHSASKIRRMTNGRQARFWKTLPLN
jgi:hypothetical protein